MIDRIYALLSNPNLDYLMVTPEFHCARGRLIAIAKSIKPDTETPVEDSAFVSLVEQHIGLVKPTIRKIYVNGEEVDCLFLTLAEV